MRISLPLTHTAGQWPATFFIAIRLSSIWRRVTESARMAGTVDAVITRSSTVTSSVCDAFGGISCCETLSRPQCVCDRGTELTRAVDQNADFILRRFHREGEQLDMLRLPDGDNRSEWRIVRVVRAGACRAAGTARLAPAAVKVSAMQTRCGSAIRSRAGRHRGGPGSPRSRSIGPGRMQTSPPSSGSALMASLIEVYLPKVFTPSPTVQVQQQPHSPSPLMAATWCGNRSPNSER